MGSVGITLKRGCSTIEKHGERADKHGAFEVYCEQESTENSYTPEKDEALR